MKNVICILVVSAFAGIYFSANAQQPVAKKVNYDSLRIVLELMFDEDQKIRRILVDSIGLDSPEAPKYIYKMNSIDAQNKIKIESILEKYGWIEQSRIGRKAAEAIFYVIQHSNLEFMERYFGQFKALAERGEANRTLCAMMEDRLRMWKGQKQIYGSQAGNGFRADKSNAIWPIENPAIVNQLRKEAGFTTTVEENAKQLKADYNPNEKLPNEKKD
jgi:hypothetical protein